MRDLIIYGDPHGEWRPLLRACREDPPAGVVILGDCDLERPLHEQIAPLFEAGVTVRWIPGNHDVDSVEWHDRLFVDHADGNLHARWCRIGDMIIAGLGGVFTEQIWYPRFENAPALFATRKSLIRSLRPADRWRSELPLAMRAAIFSEDIDALSNLHADVLVTHEAPSTHRRGFLGIDRAAAACRARLVVHGHHHETYDAHLPDGTWVRGLAKAEGFRVRREMLG